MILPRLRAASMPLFGSGDNQLPFKLRNAGEDAEHPSDRCCQSDR